MASDYRLQIVNHKDEIVHGWAPGLAVEVELIDTLCARVAAKGVGLLRSEEHVIADVRAAFHELLRELKGQI